MNPARTPLENRERRERAILLFREPEFFDDLCEFIAEGGTLLDIANKHDIPYARLHEWVQSEDTRSERYAEATTARDANIQDRVLSGIINISDATISDVFNGDGTLKDISKLPKEIASTIQSVDVTYDETGKATKKVRQYDRTKSFELLGRNQRLFTDRVEVNGTLQLADVINESMKPADGTAAPK